MFPYQINVLGEKVFALNVITSEPFCILYRTLITFSKKHSLVTFYQTGLLSITCKCVMVLLRPHIHKNWKSSTDFKMVTKHISTRTLSMVYRFQVGPMAQSLDLIGDVVWYM